MAEFAQCRNHLDFGLHSILDMMHFIDLDFDDVCGMENDRSSLLLKLLLNIKVRLPVASGISFRKALCFN